MKKTILIMILLAFTVGVKAYDSELAGFSITVNGESNPYKIFSIFVMPATEVKVISDINLSIQTADVFKLVNNYAAKSWNFKAPAKPGAYIMKFFDSNENAMQLNILVLTPFPPNKEYLNGYRIGTYPSTPLHGNPIYNKPKGLFEVTNANQSLKLTPHFTIKQFLCKQSGGFPKYLIVQERLLLKLEYLLEKVNEKGYKCETFGFISGYRTPFYNKSIKNVQYSRHVYGGAVDIFIDQNNDGSIDDLNNDGRIDDQDVRVFYDLVESQYDRSNYARFRGGLGFYKKNNSHNGFIHVDVRGTKARW